MSKTALTIGEVARATGLGVETIRYYERRGLIPEPPRRPSGYRQYPPETIARIRFITRAKELGFTLSEISDLLTMRVAPNTTCRQVKRRLEQKIDDVDGRIRSLRRMRKALTQLAESCQGDSGPTSECPILEALDAASL